MYQRAATVPAAIAGAYGMYVTCFWCFDEPAIDVVEVAASGGREREEHSAAPDEGLVVVCEASGKMRTEA